MSINQKKSTRAIEQAIAAAASKQIATVEAQVDQALAKVAIVTTELAHARRRNLGLKKLSAQLCASCGGTLLHVGNPFTV